MTSLCGRVGSVDYAESVTAVVAARSHHRPGLGNDLWGHMVGRPFHIWY